MPLTPDQLRKLRDSLIEGFLRADQLADMLVLDVGGRVYYDYTQAAPRPTEYLNIILQADAQGWVLQLVSAAAKERPHIPALEELKQELSAPAVPPDTFDDVTDARKESALQRTVRAGLQEGHSARLLAALTRAAAATGIVEHDMSAQGTGFLVSPTLVMTNCHVIDALRAAPVADLTIRLGYRILESGVIEEGKRLPFADRWLVYSRPPDPADERQDPKEAPAAEHLDYALIRLAEPANIAPTPCDPGAALPRINASLVMLQHPAGGPQRLSFGRLTAVMGENRRQRYDINTKPGSSGSPLFDSVGTLIGLHHGGDPNFDRLALYNQGIPMGLILADIAAVGIALD